MCGIAGFVDLTASTEPEQLRALARGMASTLRHRGPDDEGEWIDPDAGVALGHQRLAVIDVSPEGHQPMASADGRYVLDFNGEIYNFGELRHDLLARGVGFRGHSDTEVLVEAIAQWGVEQAVQRCNGMFAFAVWDRAERRMLLARDRMGEKPLYYGVQQGTFLFASELKALHRHPAFRGELDRGAVSLYLRYGYVPAPYSIYAGISKLPPASILEVSTDGGDLSLAPRPYWSLREVAERQAETPVGPDQAVEELDSLLADSVRMRMVADVPVGAFLSGGIDSSTVVALMQTQTSLPARTFTIGFDEPGYDEAQHAAEVASHLGTEHTCLYVTPEEARSVVPRLSETYDEPFADSSQIPTMLVAQLARTQVTVALSGDGGDELFGGYTRYLLHQGIWARARRLPRPVRRLLSSLLASVPAPGVDRAARTAGLGRISRPGDKLHKLAGVLALDDPDAIYHHLVSLWRNPAEVVVGGWEPLTAFSDPAQRPALRNPTDWLMYVDAMTYLPDDILTKVDRATMAHSLEARVPLLDHRVVELAWRIPTSVKFHDGGGKWPLRQVLERHVPAALFERPKMGFGVPVGAWLRGPLRSWADDLLAADRLHEQGLVDPQAVSAAWSQHQAGQRDLAHHLWAVLMLEAWLDHQRAPSLLEP